ncbi:unnamed protein product [Owenia fusiformis]|uniref:Transporter n=1 Tax=Owenia fusiformis TaxID=6347 RepID=A0A8S4P320_OWEFU|nr:unnamed protein product [Owenia fusiformis]
MYNLKKGGNYDISASPDPDIKVTEEGDDEETERGQWGGYCDFLLTCIGYCVGLGNVWRFPYLCFKNGGGAFLIPYIISLVLMGIPLYFMELSMGQFPSKGPITVWMMTPLFKGLGYAMVIVNTVISLYYIVIVAWVWYFFFTSMRSPLPWVDCNNRWNTPNCFDRQQAINCTALNATFFNGTVSNCSEVPELLSKTQTPAHEYFYNHVLELTDGLGDLGGMRWPLLGTLFLSWVIVFLVLIKGVASLGKVAYFSSLFPYFMMTALLIRGATLEGARKGIEFYMIPKWERLADIQVWSDAANQIFYSLGISIGTLTAMSSFNRFNHYCLRDALIVPFINCATSIYAGFAVFSVLGFMATRANLPVEQVAVSGPGLVFVVYPEGLTQMPGSPTAWAILFFIMMMFLGFSSQFSQVETIISAFNDESGGWFLRGRWRGLAFRATVCLIMFACGIPLVFQGGFYVFTIFDTYAGGFPLLIIGLLEVIVITYIYGFNRFAEDIQMMIGYKPSLFIRAFWNVITPLLLLVIIILKIVQYKPLTFGDYTYPPWYGAISWSLVALPLLFIPGVGLAVHCKNGGWKIFKKTLAPAAEWGPALNKHRTGRYEPIVKNRIELESGPSFTPSSGDELPPAYINAYDNTTSNYYANANGHIPSNEKNGPEQTMNNDGGKTNLAFEGEQRF